MTTPTTNPPTETTIDYVVIDIRLAESLTSYDKSLIAVCMYQHDAKSIAQENSDYAVYERMK